METKKEQVFPDFKDWFDCLIQDIEPSIVVAIARGAVRLLQLEDVLSGLGDINVVSDSALPFLPDSEVRNKRILLFDDSVIIGSTMSTIRDYLTQRGATVSCAAYVTDRSSFYGEEKPGSGRQGSPSRYRDIPIQIRHRLWPNEIRRHHDTLIRRLLRTPSHYNLDFPTLELNVSEYSAADIPCINNLLCKTDVFRRLVDVSSSASTQYAVFRYAGLFEEVPWHIFPKNGISLRPYSKTRLTFLPKLGQVHFTPIAQVMMRCGEKHREVIFADDLLTSLWRSLCPPYHLDDRFYHQALFRLLTSFVALVMAEVLTRRAISVLEPYFPASATRLRRDDVQFAIGSANARQLVQIQTVLRTQDTAVGEPTLRAPDHQESGEPLDRSLLRATAKAWVQRPYLKPHPSDLVYEMLGKIFLTLRAITDSAERRQKNPAMSRLEVGFTYEAIRSLLRDECGIELSCDDVSTAMDICIDNGQAVPKLVSQEGTWLRVFYSGEGEYSQETLQLKSAIGKAYSDFLGQKDTRPLSPFDMHKLCASLKDLFPWLPISSRFYTFGRYSMVGQSEEELIGWLTDPTTGPLKIEIKEGRKILLLNETYRSCVDPTWAPNRSRDFYDGFQFIATTFSKLPDEPKLLLSTCRTHRHAYNAVAVEAHNWVGCRLGDFQQTLSGIGFSPNGRAVAGPEVISCLYWCIRYISEAKKKHKVFHSRFDALINRLCKTFERQGPPAERFWKFHVVERNLLDPSREQDIEYCFRMISPIIGQMSRLTVFLLGLLIELDIFSADQIRHKFEMEGISLEHRDFRWVDWRDPWRAATQYNNAVKRQKVPGLSIVKTVLPLDPPSPADGASEEWLSGVLKTAQECLNELRTSLEEFCPKYPVVEGDFPFSPDYSRRLLRDGSVERTFPVMYILTMDIVGSTDSEQANEFKEQITSTFDRFRESGVYSEKTGNDQFVGCCENPTPLWDIAESIRLKGEVLKKAGGRLEGTRKGISFGAVRIIQTPENCIMIRDAWVPHVVPRACSILEGLDAYCSKCTLPINSVIIIEARCAARCAPSLGIQLEATRVCRVESKHFRGRCYVIDL